jgi:hypothetical protein
MGENELLLRFFKDFFSDHFVGFVFKFIQTGLLFDKGFSGQSEMDFPDSSGHA